MACCWPLAPRSRSRLGMIMSGPWQGWTANSENSSYRLVRSLHSSEPTELPCACHSLLIPHCISHNPVTSCESRTLTPPAAPGRGLQCCRRPEVSAATLRGAVGSVMRIVAVTPEASCALANATTVHALGCTATFEGRGRPLNRSSQLRMPPPLVAHIDADRACLRCQPMQAQQPRQPLREASATQCGPLAPHTRTHTSRPRSTWRQSCWRCTQGCSEAVCALRSHQCARALRSAR